MEFANAISIVLLCFSIWLFKRFFFKTQTRTPSNLPPLPEVPGIPILGNLLQLTEKKPHKTFGKWAEKYGPIYSIRTGATTMVVLNTNDVVKEALVTRFSSISTRKLSTALKILTGDKTMVATSDYDDFHKMAKRCILTHLLGPAAQRQNHLSKPRLGHQFFSKRNRSHRDALVDNMSNHLHAFSKKNHLEAVNFRHYFESELFGLAFKQVVGKDVESLYVEELNTTFSREELFNIFVLEPMMGALDVDWRDFFPYLKWVPNKAIEERVNRMHIRREACMKVLIKESRERIDSGEKTNCYLEFLLSLEKPLTEKQIMMMLWEVIIETSDTMMVATEWAMYELAKDPRQQENLYQELQNVCGPNKITEENLSQLPYLRAVFQETLRKDIPVPIVPLRYVHEDTEIGGYHVPAGSEIALNLYGCNMDKKVWENPEEWKPERFLERKNDTMDLHVTMSFGGGKRVCAGALEAFNICCVTIGRLIQEFKWRLVDGDEENVNTLGLTAKKLDPLKAMIKPRA